MDELTGLTLTEQDRADLLAHAQTSPGWRTEIEVGMSEVAQEVVFLYATEDDSEPRASVVRFDASLCEVTMQDYRRAHYGRAIFVCTMGAALGLAQRGLPDLP